MAPRIIKLLKANERKNNMGPRPIRLPAGVGEKWRPPPGGAAYAKMPVPKAPVVEAPVEPTVGKKIAQEALSAIEKRRRAMAEVMER